MTVFLYIVRLLQRQQKTNVLECILCCEDGNGSSFRAVLFEFLLNFVGFFLPVCKVSLLRGFSGRFSVIKLVKESQMNLFFAYADVRAILAVSKNGYSGHSGAIVPINFPPKSGVFKSYVLLFFFVLFIAS